MAWEAQERLKHASSLLRITERGKQIRLEILVFVFVPGLILENSYWAWTSRNTFLLKATGAEDIDHKAAQRKAMCVTQALGFLALAIVQADGCIHTAGDIAGLKNPVIYTNHCRQKTVTTFVQPK